MVLPSPPRVLVVDDDAVMRELLSALLGAEGYGIETAEHGEAALIQLQTSGHPDVILTDVQLPGLSGAGLAVQLRAAAPEARLVGMSGSDPGSATRAAFDAFLLKPFSAEDFASAVRSSRSSGPAITISSDGPPRREVEPLNETIYKSLAASLPPAQLAELYRLTLEDVTLRLERMRAALADDDLPTYRRESHALKGGCGMVGALELADLAAKAEFLEGGTAAGTTLESFATAFEGLRQILGTRFVQNR